MEGWALVCIVLIALVAVAWHLSLARRRVRQYHKQLIEAQRELDQVQDEAMSLRVRQVAIGAAITDALLALDAERRVTWANQVACRLFSEPIGKSLIEATRSHELDALLDEAHLVDEILTRQIALGQQTFGVRLVTMPAGTIIVLEDVSELQRLGRARRDFVANISHELRTPLASIRLLVDTLQAGALFDATVAPEMLTKINREVDALSQLARELLDLALIESGQMPLKLVPIDLCQLVQLQAERFSPLAQQKSITLLADISPCRHVLADQEMIERVLSNLLHNALKFTSASGQISLTTHDEGDNVIVSVSDTGPGIPDDELNRIFERFYKVDRTREQSGTGLGLAVARHIVERHGGRIWAESEPGKGAMFRFTLSLE